MKKSVISIRRRIIIVLLGIIVSIAIITCLIYRYNTNHLLISKPKQENYVDCTEELEGLSDYYNACGIGQMQIQGARKYDNGSRDAMIYIDGICNIPEANSSILLIRDYLEKNEEQFFDDAFYMHICLQGIGDDATESLAAMIEFNFEISDPIIETVYLQEGIIINSKDYECVSLPVAIVNVSACNELTEEEFYVLERNYPEADYVLP